VFIACFASLMYNGLWSNLISLINVVTAALVATNYFEPVSDLFEDLLPAYAAACDIVAVWVVFAGSLGIFGIVTDALSRTKVRFLKPIDQYGGMFLAAWVGWVAVCFTAMTLHMAPLPRSFAGGTFQPSHDARMLLGLAPDHRWLGFEQKMSRHTYWHGDQYIFDPRAEFILKYAQRRFALESGGSWARTEKGSGFNAQ
jgi:hypothetical protein